MPTKSRAWGRNKARVDAVADEKRREERRAYYLQRAEECRQELARLRAEREAGSHGGY